MACETRPVILGLTSALLTVIAIPVLFLIYGFWVHQYSEKPIRKFCESLEAGIGYDQVLEKSTKVKNASLNKYSLGSDLVQLHSDTMLLGYICFMVFENQKLKKSYWQERD